MFKLYLCKSLGSFLKLTVFSFDCTMMLRVWINLVSTATGNAQAALALTLIFHSSSFGFFCNMHSFQFRSRDRFEERTDFCSCGEGRRLDDGGGGMEECEWPPVSFFFFF